MRAVRPSLGQTPDSTPLVIIPGTPAESTDPREWRNYTPCG